VKNKERLLSATRRKNAYEYDTEDLVSSKLSTTKHRAQYNRVETETHDNHLPLASVSEKKSRPLSATRKSEMKDKLDDNAEEIFKAMAEENQSVESKPSGSKTAPERRKYCASPSPSEVKRSSSMMSSHPLKTDDTIALVTEKVRKMDARQQQHLIEILAKLDCKASLKGSSASSLPPSSPRKATETTMPSASSEFAENDKESEDYVTADSLDSCENRKDSEDFTDVYFEIFTNWGNPQFVGLTEVGYNWKDLKESSNSCIH